MRGKRIALSIVVAGRVSPLLTTHVSPYLTGSEFEIVYDVFVLPVRETLIELLGFKYKYYMSTPAGGEASNGTAPAVPDELFKQTSLMIQHGILEMDSIYAMLGPDDKQIEEEAAFFTLIGL